MADIPVIHCRESPVLDKLLSDQPEHWLVKRIKAERKECDQDAAAPVFPPHQRPSSNATAANLLQPLLAAFKSQQGPPASLVHSCTLIVHHHLAMAMSNVSSQGLGSL